MDRHDPETSLSYTAIGPGCWVSCVSCPISLYFFSPPLPDPGSIFLLKSSFAFRQVLARRALLLTVVWPLPYNIKLRVTVALMLYK